MILVVSEGPGDGYPRGKPLKKIAGLEKLIMGFPKSLTKVKSVHGARRTSPSKITFLATG